jgi:hypothetical protein
MTLRTRRALAVVSLAAALWMALPAPSAARQPGGWGTVALWERAWAWVAQLRAGRDGAAQDKEGSGINPDGRTTPAPPPPTTNGTPSEEGTAVNQDGRN